MVSWGGSYEWMGLLGLNEVVILKRCPIKGGLSRQVSLYNNVIHYTLYRHAHMHTYVCMRTCIQTCANNVKAAKHSTFIRLVREFKTGYDIQSQKNLDSYHIAGFFFSRHVYIFMNKSFREIS